ncbi:MAG: hypothetical protein IKQ80_03940 [Clostridia bacterium]|nr:hypothetical protein [Clostridia bacterium]MBR6889902.1 hypothetical protein [Clostridia bacterium]
MAVFTSSAFAMRRNLILEALRDAGAVSPETAKALEETGLVNPEMFAEYTQQLVDMGVIRSTADGRYYAD